MNARAVDPTSGKIAKHLHIHRSQRISLRHAIQFRRSLIIEDKILSMVHLDGPFETLSSSSSFEKISLDYTIGHVAKGLVTFSLSEFLKLDRKD